MLNYIYLHDEGENPFEGSSANELRAKVLSLKQVMLVRRKTVDPLNASEQDNPIFPFKQFAPSGAFLLGIIRVFRVRPLIFVLF